MAGATHRVAQATIDGDRLKQKANNEKSAAESALQRFSAGLGNRRRMDAAGKQIATIESNIARNIDAKAIGDLQGQIGAAEELGSLATMAGAAGVGGSSVDTFNNTLRLTKALSDGQTDRAFEDDLYAANQDKGATLIDAVAGLDNNQYRANLDYRQWVDHKKMSTFQQIATLGVAAAATYFGGPQAGQAVIAVSEGINQAQNGDFAAAGNSFTGAAQAGSSSYNNTRSMGGSYWGKPQAPTPQIGGTMGGGGAMFKITGRG